MEIVILSIHLVVCLSLIGLVLLQRSEGGALGMGGGGGSLMSGRGAADALARMTSVAGGFFLVTSLGLTMLSGAQASSEGGSIFDRAPITSAPAAPVAPVPEVPDPTESSLVPETQLASLDQAAAAAPVVAAPAPVVAAARAAPLTTPPPPSQTAAIRPPAAAPGQRGGAPAPAPAPPQRSTAISPNATGVSGITLTEDPAVIPESVDVGNGLEAVRRDRAGPDQ